MKPGTARTSAATGGPVLGVLLVEDEAALASAVARALKAHGYSVSRAESAEQALALGPADLLITDLCLPGSSGLDLYAELRERGQVGDCILLAGLPGLDDCRRALQLGVRDLLSKPFGLDQLIEAVERVRTDRAQAASATDRDRFDRTYELAGHGRDEAVLELAAFALSQGVASSTRIRIASACCELLDNCWRHAAEGGERVRVRAERRELRFRISIEDDGPGFDYLRVRTDSTPTLLPGQGLCDSGSSGLTRVESLAEDLRLSSDGAGTRAELEFALFPVTFDEEHGLDLCDVEFLDPNTSRRLLQAIESGESRDFLNMPPSLAVTVGRLLAGRSPDQTLQTALWS